MLQKTQPQNYFANVTATLKALKEIEHQGDNAKTYQELERLIGRAAAIRLYHKDVTEIRHEAEWTMISLRHTLGGRIGEVPKGKGNQYKVQSFPGDTLHRGDLPFSRKTRARLLKLRTIAKKELRRICEDLWATDDDATLKAIFDETKLEDFQAARARREAALGSKILAMPNKRYGVILADPEWKFKTYSVKGKVLTSAERHYPTSELSAIKKRKPPAAKDCVLFLWATAPMLPQAFEVMDAWGFEYVSNLVWDKEKTGTGYWFMNQHEHLLVGKRGKVVPPAMGTQWPSVIREKAGRHSQKPEKSYQLIEEYFPSIPRIELNQRKARPGWDGWGNEVP